MTKRITKEKILRRVRGRLVGNTRGTRIYLYIYPAYWHYLLHKDARGSMENVYYSARPNQGAGIGHQMANWIAGYWFARQFGLKFAHLPFATKRWDEFLGFGEDEVSVGELRRRGYKVRRLPLFNENDPDEVALQRRIIASYAGQRVVFVAEQDQFYRDQYGVMADIQRKFYGAAARKGERLRYSPDNYNIAIHVRRGDIMANPDDPGLAMRFLSNDYFERVLTQVIDRLHEQKPVHIWFFSQGKPDDYPEFAHFANLHWCMDMGAEESFLHMVRADLLITSKSSFSYKPALLSRGVKVCPRNFWHGYPSTPDWVMVENDGTIIFSEERVH